MGTRTERSAYRKENDKILRTERDYGRSNTEIEYVEQMEKELDFPNAHGVLQTVYKST